MNKLNNMSPEALKTFLNNKAKSKLIKIITDSIYRKQERYSLKEVRDWQLLPYIDKRTYLWLEKDWELKLERLNIWPVGDKIFIKHDEIERFKKEYLKINNVLIF